MTTPNNYTTPLNINEAAERMGVSHRFIRERIADGSLKAYRLRGSRLYRIDPADLEALKEPTQ